MVECWMYVWVFMVVLEFCAKFTGTEEMMVWNKGQSRLTKVFEYLVTQCFNDKDLLQNWS